MDNSNISEHRRRFSGHVAMAWLKMPLLMLSKLSRLVDQDQEVLKFSVSYVWL